MNMDARNAANLRSATATWDGQQPPEQQDDFLDTDEGRNWLYDDSRELVAGSDIPAAVVTHDSLLEQVSELIEQRRADCYSPALEMLLCQIAASSGRYPELYRLLLEFLGVEIPADGSYSLTWTPIHDVARTLLASNVDTYLAAMQGDADDYYP